MTPRRLSTTEVEHLDLTPLAERLRQRLVAGGAPHGGVGALLLALRGAAGEERATFAARLSVDEHWLEQAEAGAVALRDLPHTVHEMADSMPGLKLEWIVEVLSERGVRRKAARARPSAG